VSSHFSAPRLVRPRARLNRACLPRWARACQPQGDLQNMHWSPVRQALRPIGSHTCVHHRIMNKPLRDMHWRLL